MQVDTGVAKSKNAYLAEQVRSIADVETVAEYLGLETQRCGSRISILCPCHNDRHFKSCYLTNDGFVCYSCHAKGDMISLVQITLNISFNDACNYILGIYGQKAEDFQVEKPLKPILRDDDLRLIGLGQDQENKRLYKEISFLSTTDEVDPEPGQRIAWWPGFFAGPKDPGNEDDVFVLQELISTNPLRDLLNENEAAYNDLIFRKSQEASEKYSTMLDMVVNPAKYLFGEDHVEAAIAHLCIEVAKQTGVQMWADEMERKIRRCDDLRIEFGMITAQKKEELETPRKRKSVFGKIKTGGASI